MTHKKDCRLLKVAEVMQEGKRYWYCSCGENDHKPFRERVDSILSKPFASLVLSNGKSEKF